MIVETKLSAVLQHAKWAFYHFRAPRAQGHGKQLVLAVHIDLVGRHRAVAVHDCVERGEVCWACASLLRGMGVSPESGAGGRSFCCGRSARMMEGRGGVERNVGLIARLLRGDRHQTHLVTRPRARLVTSPAAGPSASRRACWSCPGGPAGTRGSAG